jgi:hypothetical protein
MPNGRGSFIVMEALKTERQLQVFHSNFKTQTSEASSSSWCVRLPLTYFILPADLCICVACVAATKTLRIPKVFHVGPMPNGRGSFIVMEALKMSGSCSMSELGRQLGRMHLAEPAVRSFGWQNSDM